MKRCCCFRRSQKKSRGAGPLGRKERQERRERNSLKQKLLHKDKETRSEIETLGPATPKRRKAEAERPPSDSDRLFGAHVAFKMPPHFQATLGGTTGAGQRTNRSPVGLSTQKSLILSLQITETRGSLQRSTSTRQGGFFGEKWVRLRKHVSWPVVSASMSDVPQVRRGPLTHHRGRFSKAGGETDRSPL